MIQIRRGDQRGHFNHGWLKTYHTFSFADYYDPAQMGFRSLRVMNEDTIEPEQGFGMHGHRDMEIITYVLSGELAHRDSLGNEGRLKAGEVQTMSAGSGIRHSEFNPSSTEPLHLYQIWILPERPGLVPSYEQRTFDPKLRQGKWQTIVSKDGSEGSLVIHQDAAIQLADLPAGAKLTRDLAAGRNAWLQVLRGTVECGGKSLVAGDGAAISEESRLELEAKNVAEVMLFDLA